MKKALTVAAVALVLWLLWEYFTSSGGSGGQGSAGTTDTAIGGNALTAALQTMIDAITHFEGGNPGNRNVRDNNPGNLTSAAVPGPDQGGISGSDSQFAVFSSAADGIQALADYITNHATVHPEWDFYDFFDWYLNGTTAPQGATSQGNSDAYAEYVASQLGVDPTTPLSQVVIGS